MTRLARLTFTAIATALGDHRYELAVKRGPWRKSIDKRGDEVAVVKETGPLWSNIGDRLVVSSTDLDCDDIAMCEVVSVDGRGMPMVRVVRGQMPSAGSVWVQPAAKAKSKRSRAA